MKEEILRDEELAAFTDAVLDAQAGMVAPDRPPCADVVDLLARALRAEQPPAGLRRRVRESVAAEWARQRGAAGHSPFRVLSRHGRPWVWATIGALTLLAAAAALLVPSGAARLTGAAVGGPGLSVAVALLVLAGGLALAWLFSRR
jgi:hypothetical protein